MFDSKNFLYHIAHMNIGITIRHQVERKAKSKERNLNLSIFLAY